MSIKSSVVVLIFLTLTSLLFPDNDYNIFLKENDSEVLNDLFTLNIGVMNFRNIGDIQNIDPVDSETIVEVIKNELEDVKLARLNRKAATLKAIEVYLSRNGDVTSDIEKKAFSNLEFFEEKVFYSNDNTEQSLIYEVFLEFNKNTDFFTITKKWIENIENPFYSLNVSEPFERILKKESDICRTKTANDKGPLDFLFYGELEKIDNVYFVNIYAYSALLKRRVADIAFVAESKDLASVTSEKINSILPKVFLINYATLKIITGDEDVRIYLDSNYVGRKDVLINYLNPGNYVITLKKENYEDVIENVNLKNFDDKKIELEMAEKEKLQVMNFFIEPYGSKIFINSVYQGKSPFKKALPIGNYIIYAKNELYENHRYIFQINQIEDTEKDIVFHLLSKDIKNLFKLKKTLYYVSFWNFTFSLATTVPFIVVTAYLYEVLVQGADTMPGYLDSKTGRETYDAWQAMLGASVALSVYSVLSLGWLFYALANYLLALEKKDFIPIIEFYENKEGVKGLTLGMRMKLK